MMTRKKIDLILLSVDAEKLSQREWDYLKLLKPMDPSSIMIATTLLEHRGDTVAFNRLKSMPDII